MTFHIITLFPESLDSYIHSSIVGRAISDKKIKIKFYNPRDYTKDKHRRVDRQPYGGGPGMVLEAESVVKAVEKALKSVASSKYLESRKTKKTKGSSLDASYKMLTTAVIWLSPSGKQFDNTYAEKAAKKYSDIIIICGRYEGVDARTKKILKDSRFKIQDLRFDIIDLSVGPYVLTGGELPAMIIIDTIARRIPGVLGKIESVEENRVASSEVYTRPEVLTYKGKKYKVPKVLMSGNHAKIEEWRKGKKK